MAAAKSRKKKSAKSPAYKVFEIGGKIAQATGKGLRAAVVGVKKGLNAHAEWVAEGNRKFEENRQKEAKLSGGTPVKKEVVEIWGMKFER